MNPLDRSIALGPLGVSLGQLLLALAMVVALIVGAWMGRRRQVSVGDLLFNALLIGVVGARIVFVARYWESYDTFWSWLDIRDRGFEPLAGLVIAFVYLAWRFWRHPTVRRPLGAAVLSGALAWSMTAGALALMAPRGASLPSIPLADLDGSQVTLPAVLQEADRPMVVNLWASWCPPCRREMPMLEQAQQERDDVSFVFVNQGESVDTVETFLQRESLALDHLYRDPNMAFGREVGAMAMPTTLYYNADGQLVDTHFGELSRATLDRSLERFEP
ncbi:prolipoprotein diacylglyceryl transferase family protein [Modicisalibacter sp. MOD 31.J]|uniref:prolipoprotein diacylglyceryl transferase family protein n=1 Tax=Modicisalibacter sp. MOD 31.J TaxID=2831897 RepID=UPI001CC8F2C2|nr:prolipoprotein diacylglyceryl transferase family protein [Modicisalibacter sp. MOD 31.J]MBZ9574617.1 redoxin family protein [Modicisalibacter sp. MOD 31.J]